MTSRSSASARDVWITGVGAVTPAGWGAASSWNRVKSGASHLQPLTRFPRFNVNAAACGPVPNAEERIARGESFAARFGISAAKEALEMASLGATDVPVLILANHGERKLPVGDGSSVRASIETVVQCVATEVGVQMSLPVYAACAGGALAIGLGYNLVRFGMVERALVGGTDSNLNPIDYWGFAGLYAMSVRAGDATQASCPFDRRRDGFVLAEGAGILVLEAADSARARGASPMAVISGYGNTQSAYHIVASDPDGRGSTDAMLEALKQAGLNPDQVGYVNAHGTSTPDNDRCETRAIKNALGSHAYDIPVSSIKGSLGHTMGAAGAIETIMCVFALRDQIIPPTVNLSEPDPDCDLDYVPVVPRSARFDAVLKNSFGFGGHNVSLVIRSAS